MLRRLAHRLTVTCYVALSLLFSQLALANYVCPQEQDMAAMADMVASGTPCEGMDMDQPALCAEHSSNTPSPSSPSSCRPSRRPWWCRSWRCASTWATMASWRLR
ncbi:hypothetical protein ACFJIX_22680 [Roseateles sp. UC29_93]|uniref:hypothetical protein n=1 Tax=Roseateles sp. UC29_93 TaxID=3350177 RepID=UPI00366BD09A